MRRWSLLGVMLSGFAWGQSSVLGIENSGRLLVPNAPREMRAAWVATVWNIDWPTTRNNVTNQRTQMNAILDGLAQLNMNAVFLQVRSQCDALYPSSLEPWSYFLTGRMGRAPTPTTYDPLQEWITAARNRGMQLYAWINPYRALVQTPGGTDAGFIDPLHVSNSNPSVVVDYGGDKWLDPGKVGASNHSKSVIQDILTRYDVDGIVFDDYFYPYPDGTNPFPDSATYSAYTAGGGTLSLANWRRQNVNTFVFDIQQMCRAVRPHALFGIGPFGIWKSGTPPGIVGLSAYDSLYADSKLWLNNGWVDFLAPQLYWKISATQQSYPVLLSWWASQNTQNRHLWASNYTSKLDGSASGWPAQEILDQIVVTRNQAGASGNVHYSAKALRDNWQSIKTLLMGDLYSNDCLIPATTWIANTGAPPSQPNLSVSRTGNTVSVNWSDSALGSAPRWWAVQYHLNGVWKTDVFPSTQLSLSLSAKGTTGSLKAIAVSAVDRMGRQSPVASRTFDPSLLQQNNGD